MTATYNNTLPTTLDRMRFAVGDINFTELDTSGALRQDEEYDALVLLTGDWRLAVADMADSLAAQYAQSPDSFTAQGDMSVSWRERVSTWLSVARRYRTEVADELAASGVTAVSSTSPERDYPDESEYAASRLYERRIYY